MKPDLGPILIPMALLTLSCAKSATGPAQGPASGPTGNLPTAMIGEALFVSARTQASGLPVLLRTVMTVRNESDAEATLVL